MKNNINVFLHKLFSHTVALRFLVLILAGCAFDADVDSPRPGTGTSSGELMFSTNIPDSQLPASSTKGMADGNESVVTSIDLLIFNSSTSNQPFVELVHGTNINQTGSTVTFNAKPVNKLSGNVCAVVLANSRAVLTSSAMTSLL